jgi:hypothetical protein
VGDRSKRTLQLLAATCDETGGKRRRRSQRHLLTEHGAYRQLGTVHGADDTAAGRLGSRRSASLTL